MWLTISWSHFNLHTSTPTYFHPHPHIQCARAGARCDYGLFLGANNNNACHLPLLSSQAFALKMYLNKTFGSLQLDSMDVWMKVSYECVCSKYGCHLFPLPMQHFEQWPKDHLICMHAEGHTTAAVILLCELYKRPVHICHVARKEEVTHTHTHTHTHKHTRTHKHTHTRTHAHSHKHAHTHTNTHTHAQTHTHTHTHCTHTHNTHCTHTHTHCTHTHTHCTHTHTCTHTCIRHARMQGSYKRVHTCFWKE